MYLCITTKSSSGNIFLSYKFIIVGTTYCEIGRIFVSLYLQTINLITVFQSILLAILFLSIHCEMSGFFLYLCIATNTAMFLCLICYFLSKWFRFFGSIYCEIGGVFVSLQYKISLPFEHPDKSHQFNFTFYSKLMGFFLYNSFQFFKHWKVCTFALN